jgi:hypothetical protein
MINIVLIIYQGIFYGRKVENKCGDFEDFMNKNKMKIKN